MNLPDLSPAELPALRITLPLPAKEASPNARVHWGKKARLARSMRNLAWGLTRKALGRSPGPRWPQAETRAVFYFADGRTRDRDNAAASLKAYWDGIADAGVVTNDSGLVHQPPEMRVDKTAPRVEITVVPTPANP